MNDNLIRFCGAGLIATVMTVGIGLSAEASTPVFTPEPGKPVHYNWGWGSPKSGFPADHFNAVFNQSGYFTGGDYFLQTFADDGVKVEVDGKMLINRWSDYNGQVDRAFWLGVKSGQHTVKTHYYENVAVAGVFSDVVPFDSWLAYYYPNESLSGMPTAAKVIKPTGDLKKLYEDFSWGAPASGVGKDHFSARYTTAKRIPAGDYILRARADDGIRVYVDGKLVVDRWTGGAFREDAVKIPITNRPDANPGEEDIHWIEVEYFESVASGKVEFFLEPFQKATVNAWVGEIYPNMSLKGNPYIIGGNNSLRKITDINFDWGWGLGSPLDTVPGDRFSARFTKKVNIAAGTYVFNANGDDGVRVFLDNKLIINTWPGSGLNKKSDLVHVSGGEHTIKVEYLEDVGAAKLSFNYKLMTQMPTKVGNTVRYNWGWGSPGTGIPADYFSGIFDQSGTYSSGDYFLQTFADDGVKVEVDGKTLINRWSEYTGKTDKALWLGVTAGEHKIKTHYYEAVAVAGVYSDIVPLDSWLAYYFPNKTLSGMPTAAKVIAPSGTQKKLYEDFGWGAPAAGMPADQFSARYTTAKRLKAGEYILRPRADDGIRVYVDGQLVLDRWTGGAFREDAVKLNISDRENVNPGEEDVHWIEVEYYEDVAGGKVEVFLEPYERAITGAWVGEIYPNKNLQGIPYVLGGTNSFSQISALDFNWGWGNGSPHPLVPGEGFSARFTKKMNLQTGTYSFIVDADDAARVLLDGQVIINNWPATGSTEKRQGIFINGGEHTITVEYLEDMGNAYLQFEPKFLSPKKVFYQWGKNVESNWGTGGPATFPADGFEAIFDQSGYYNGGDYFLQTFADDGVKVNVDGNQLINRWTGYTGKVDRALWLGATAGKHSIMTEYYDNVSTAAVFSHVVPFDSWLAYYFPNETMSGMPAASKVIAPNGTYKKLYDDFGSGAAAPGMPTDHFSARYVTAKRIPAGNYVLRTRADDGTRVYIDGKLVLDRWSGALNEETVRVQIANRQDVKVGEQDIHWIEVEYYDNVSFGGIDVSIEPSIGPVYLTTYYDRTLTAALDIQMTQSPSPQTDLHAKFLREDALTRDANGFWYVNGTGWNVRGGPGTDYSVVGTINNGVEVSILKTIITPDQPTWYQVSAWMNALRNDVEYYMNPSNFPKGSTEYFQFLKLSESAGLNVNEVNSKILNGKGILQGKASSFVDAGTRYGINEVYLISHALLETGNGTSPLATGVTVSQVDGQSVVPKTVYNMYGINAKDACPIQCGSEYAYKMGWTSPELAIVGGAKFIADGYINKGQDTLYKMRWNPSAPGTHQYATDIGWATKQVRRIKSLYDLLSNYSLVFDEPRYRQ